MVVADELDERRGVRFPILWKAFEVFEDGMRPVVEKRATASSVYLSKSVSKMP